MRSTNQPLMASMLLLTAFFACSQGVATAADAESLRYPNGLALTAGDELIVSDIGRHAIYKVSQDGKLLAIAGSGRAGFSGDGGPAIDAKLNAPFDVVVAADGAIVFTDTYNHRIRR